MRREVREKLDEHSVGSNETRMFPPEDRRDSKGGEMAVIAPIDYGNVKRSIDKDRGHLILPWRAVQIMVKVARKITR